MDKLTPEAVAQAPAVTAADVVDADALLHELAGLSPLEYDRRREAAAKLLGVRVTTLDAEVATRRPSQERERETSTPVLFTDPEPWPEPVNGSILLDTLTTLFACHASLPEGGADALALWTLHTHAHDAAQVSPILCLSSPQKRCGKTTVLSLLRAVVRRPLPASNITAAALFRATELWRPTLLIDEADTFLRDSDELRGVLNSGHTRATAYIIRTVGDTHEPRAFCTWAPKAIALIGGVPATLADRAIVLPMRRKLPGETITRLRLEQLSGFQNLHRQCLRWATDHLACLAETAPVVPTNLHDREADNWRPLCAIAEVAGDAWPTRVMQAISALVAWGTDDETATILLLQDVAQIFTQRQTDRITSKDLVEALRTLEERPWPEWKHGKPISPRQVAALLAPFGVVPKNLRTPTGVARGYLLADCLDAFARYLPSTSATPLQLSNDADSPYLPATTNGASGAEQKLRLPIPDKTGSVVADQQGELWRITL
jgi:putative DNA primase/helicase